MTDSTDGSETIALVRKFRDGDVASREALVARIYERLVRLARLILKNGSARVQRWEQTDDLVHGAWLRIQRAIEAHSTDFTSREQIFRLAARHLRFEIIDMHRRHRARSQGHQTKPPDGESLGTAEEERYPASESEDPKLLANWIAFHESVERMPEPLKEITDLLWYQGLTQEEAAQLLNVSVRSVKRRWRDAKLHLAQALEIGMLD